MQSRDTLTCVIARPAALTFRLLAQEGFCAITCTKSTLYAVNMSTCVISRPAALTFRTCFAMQEQFPDSGMCVPCGVRTKDSPIPSHNDGIKFICISDSVISDNLFCHFDVIN